MIRIWEKCKAWWRGERMVEGVSRGRCFEKKNQTNNGGGNTISVKPKPQVKLKEIKVIRTDGTEEVIKNG